MLESYKDKRDWEGHAAAQYLRALPIELAAAVRRELRIRGGSIISVVEAAQTEWQLYSASNEAVSHYYTQASESGRAAKRSRVSDTDADETVEAVVAVAAAAEHWQQPSQTDVEPEWDPENRQFNCPPGGFMHHQSGDD
jgi:hypothetical protein